MVPWDGVVQDVVVAEDDSAVLVFLTRIGPASGRVEVVVVGRSGTDVMWEGDGKLSGWVVVTEEDVGESMATLLGWVELLDESGGVVGHPILGDWLAGGENNDGGFSGVGDSTDELALSTDQVEGVDINVLTSGGIETLPELILVSGPGTDDDDSNIGRFGGGNGFWETGVIVRPTLAALSIDNVVGTDSSSDTVVWSDTAL